MAERTNEPLLQRREPSAPSKRLTADVAAELGLTAERPAKVEAPRLSATSVALSFLALLDPLPSDYYLG